MVIADYITSKTIHNFIMTRVRHWIYATINKTDGHPVVNNSVVVAFMQQDWDTR